MNANRTKIQTLGTAALRPMALSLALLGAGLAFTQASRADSVGTADSALVAADGTRVEAADAPSAGRGDFRPGAERGMRGHGGHGGPQARGPRGHARFADLQLTEAQRDKLFELRHAQAPALRTQMKELRTARTELRTLAMSDRYDETRANELTQRAAKAQASIAMLQARGQHEFYRLLTPEQRQKLEASRAQRGGERGGFHGRRG